MVANKDESLEVQNAEDTTKVDTIGEEVANSEQQSTSLEQQNNDYSYEAGVQQINNMYDQSAEAIQAEYEQQWQKQRDEYQNTRDDVGKTYWEQQNDLANQYNVARRNMAMNDVANGLNTGTFYNRQESLSNVYYNNNAQLETAKSEQIAELDKAMADLDSEYQKQVNEALANNELERAQKLYDEWNSGYTKAMEKAQILGNYGDFSGYKDLGYSDEEIAAMVDEYNSSKEEVEAEKALERAQTLATYGDFSGYLRAGYTLEEVQKMQNAWIYQNAQVAYLSGMITEDTYKAIIDGTLNGKFNVQGSYDLNKIAKEIKQEQQVTKVVTDVVNNSSELLTPIAVQNRESELSAEQKKALMNNVGLIGSYKTDLFYELDPEYIAKVNGTSTTSGGNKNTSYTPGGWRTNNDADKYGIGSGSEWVRTTIHSNAGTAKNNEIIARQEAAQKQKNTDTSSYSTKPSEGTLAAQIKSDEKEPKYRVALDDYDTKIIKEGLWYGWDKGAGEQPDGSWEGVYNGKTYRANSMQELLYKKNAGIDIEDDRANAVPIYQDPSIGETKYDIESWRLEEAKNNAIPIYQDPSIGEANYDADTARQISRENSFAVPEPEPVVQEEETPEEYRARHNANKDTPFTETKEYNRAHEAGARDQADREGVEYAPYQGAYTPKYSGEPSFFETAINAAIDVATSPWQSYAYSDDNEGQKVVGDNWPYSQRQDDNSLAQQSAKDAPNNTSSYNKITERQQNNRDMASQATVTHGATEEQIDRDLGNTITASEKEKAQAEAKAQKEAEQAREDYWNGVMQRDQLANNGMAQSGTPYGSYHPTEVTFTPQEEAIIAQEEQFLAAEEARAQFAAETQANFERLNAANNWYAQNGYSQTPPENVSDDEVAIVYDAVTGAGMVSSGSSNTHTTGRGANSQSNHSSSTQQTEVTAYGPQYLFNNPNVSNPYAYSLPVAIGKGLSIGRNLASGKTAYYLPQISQEEMDSANALMEETYNNWVASNNTNGGGSW